VTNRLLLATQD